MLGDFEFGLPITRRAMALNPHHPGWYYFSIFDDHYLKHEYEKALATAKKIDMPGHYFYYSSIAAAAGQLGLTEEAESAIDELLKLFPDFPQRARANYELLNLPSQLINHLLDGLRKAGLKVEG